MKILIGQYIYESQGVPFSNEDVSELLSTHNVKSISKLNSILEAIVKKNEDEDKNVPDLQAPPEVEAETEKMKASQEKAQDAPVGDTPVEPSIDAPTEDKPAPEEPEAPVEPDVAEDKVDEPAPVEEPEVDTGETKEEPPKEEKPEKVQPLSPPTTPPAIEPKTELPEELKKPVEWLPSKKLSTLYNNFIDFFGEESVNKAGTVVGLSAPGLKHDSKYVQCDITADVQGSESKPYRVWIKLRRQRNTQNWSFNNPCEVRCSCKAFAYYLGYSNVKNKSLAGTPTRGKTYRDEGGIKRTLNFLLPAHKNNPAAVPALCKHLALVSKKLLDNGMITEE